MKDFFISSEMPKKEKQVEPVEIEEPTDTGEPSEPLEPLKPKYKRKDVRAARKVISDFKEQNKERPKRKCTEKQLAALAAGRAKNSRFKTKQ